MINRSKLLFLTIVATLIAPVSPSAYADPPPWAPAHGWRKKHDPYYIGYSGRKWGRDYGIIRGECQWETIGTVLGGVVGGAIGSSVGKDGNRAVAIIIGGAIGAVIGNQIGKAIDQNDRGCIGHALELGGDRQTIYWHNPQARIDYELTPIRGFSANGQKCREYELATIMNGSRETSVQKACRAGNATWKPYQD